MGSGSTKIISYDDASKRFSQSELDRLESTFRDVTNGTGELGYMTFKRDLFAYYLPEKLATPLYHVCTSSSRSSMSWKDMVCCLALIFYGTQKERMQLLYLVLSHNVTNNSGTLKWRDVKDFLSHCGDSPSEEFERLFQNDEIITQDKFITCLKDRSGQTTTIIDWIMDESFNQRLNQIMIEKQPNQYAILAGVTHLNDSEVFELEKSYHQMTSYQNRQYQITLQTFSNILTPVLPPILIPGFFDAFDQNRDGCIDMKEFVCGISAACRGPTAERHKFLFRVFDRDHDGLLNRCDLVHMSSCLINVAQFVNSFEVQMNDSPDIYTDRILHNRSEPLQQEDFLDWCTKDRLIDQLVELIFQICHVVLGLKPMSKPDEIKIVKDYLRREQYPFVEAQSGVSSKTYHWINCNRATSKPGSIWYLISIDWWLRWESSTSSSEMTLNAAQKKNSSSKLNKLANSNEVKKESDEIDNTLLIDKLTTSSSNRNTPDECTQLKLGLRHRIHYEMVPELLWKFLRKYYRCNGTAIARKVTYKSKLPRPELDLYPLLIKVYRSQNFTAQQLQTIANSNNNSNSSMSTTSGAAAHAMHFVYPLLSLMSSSHSSQVSNLPQRHVFSRNYFISPYQSVHSLCEELSSIYGKPLDEIRLYIKVGENESKLIDFEKNDQLTCYDAGFDEKTELVVDIRNQDLTWPEELYTLATRPKPNSNQSTNQTNEDTAIDQSGLIGLSNLGNTCFLNSAVQCLSHSSPLTHYFRQRYHLYEINKDNPIGMQGMIALSYGHLVSKLWESTRGPLAPLELRGSVAKFASSRFTEFQQHDAQEFLSFLLDGLHEDLNRVHNKPYVELKDSDDRPDEEVAKEHWHNHLARNHSIIVDLFHGLLRSQVQCRVCDLKSVRFDPFNILSLPLPVDTSVFIRVKLIRLDGSKPTQFGFKLDGEQLVKVLKTELAELSSLSIEQIGFFETTNSQNLQVNLLMEREQAKIKQINNRDLLAYELPIYENEQINEENKETNANRYKNYLIAIHRRLEHQDRYFSPITRHRTLFFGQPILIPYQPNLTMNTSNRMIYMIVFKQLKRLLRKTNENNNAANHAFDCDDSLGERYPFTLKYVQDDGRKCSVCPWNRFCLGCPIELNDKDFVYPSGILVIEWESSAYHLRYLSHCEEEMEIHSSVKLSRSNYNDYAYDDPSNVVRLEHCLESFIQAEDLDQKELFNCKRCRQMQPAQKKLDIWKLPPFLIFHIKRFQLSNRGWIKSSRAVRVPIDSFHPTEYLAQRSSSATSVLARRDDENISSSSSSLSSFTGITSEVVSPSSMDNVLILSPSRLLNGHSSVTKASESLIDSAAAATLPMTTSTATSTTTNTEGKKKKKSRFGRRKQKASKPTQEINLAPPRFSQMEERTLSYGDNSFDANNSAYSLYAFICHYGVIGGGHYVAFIKHKLTNQWYCFNDSSVKLVSKTSLEQYASSAYLLFYERHELNYERYMPDLTGKKQVANELPATNDDRFCSLM